MSAFRYGWDANKDGSESFWLRFDACTREPKGWKEELYAAARALAARTNKPIWVCFSGGFDSEIACRALYDQKIPFSVLTLEHDTGTNQHDIRYAIRWCDAHGVTQKMVKINMREFLTSEIKIFSKRYVAIHPFRYLQIKLLEIVEEMGGYAVLCSGEQLYIPDQRKSVITRADLYLELSNGNAMPLEWCKDNKTSHESYFHFSTPELCLSYMRIPIVAFALNNPNDVLKHRSSTYSLKQLAYLSVWNDLEPRAKFDGFEKIQPLFIESRDNLRKRFAEQYVSVDLSVNEFERQLTGVVVE